MHVLLLQLGLTASLLSHCKHEIISRVWVFKFSFKRFCFWVKKTIYAWLALTLILADRHTVFLLESTDRPKTGFTFTAENETTTESDISFSAENETKTKLFCHFRPKTKTKTKLCIFSKTLKNKWLLLIQHPYHITVSRSHQSHRRPITVVIYIEIKRQILSPVLRPIIYINDGI